MPVIFSISIFLVLALTLISSLIFYRYVVSNKSKVDEIPSDGEDAQANKIFEAVEDLKRLQVKIIKVDKRINPELRKRIRARAIYVARAARPYGKSNKKSESKKKDVRTT